MISWDKLTDVPQTHTNALRSSVSVKPFQRHWVKAAQKEAESVIGLMIGSYWW